MGDKTDKKHKQYEAGFALGKMKYVRFAMYSTLAGTLTDKTTHILDIILITQEDTSNSLPF